MTTPYRKKFENFKRSSEGKYVKELLYRNQLTLCCSCKKHFPINKLELHHTYPLSLAEKEGNFNSVVDYKNLCLLCRHCNASQGSKIDERFD